MPPDDSKPPRPPYWRPLTIEGQAIDLSHLEPFQHAFHVDKLGRSLTYDVKFTNHCFTGRFEEGVHAPARKIMDGSRARVFCETRYGLSKRLPEMVRDLPSQTVARTRAKRNFVYAAQLDDGTGGSYTLYFTIEKQRTTRYQIAILVESAYPVTADQLSDTMVGTRDIPFSVLCAETFLALPVKPRARR